MTGPFDLLSTRPESTPLCPRADGEGWLSRSDLQAGVGELSARSEATAPKSQSSSVIVVTSDRYQMLLACLTAWRQGRTVVLPPNNKPHTLAEIGRASGADRLWTDRNDVNLEGLPHVLQLPLDSQASPNGSRVRSCSIDPKQQVLTIFTSGSTGQHQRCTKTAAQLFGEAEVLVDSLGFGQHSVVAATVPAHHLYGLLFTLLVPLFAGARFIRPTLFQPADVKQMADRYQVTDLITVPAHIRALLGGGEPLTSLRRAVSSGAVIEPAVARQFAGLSSCEVVDILGSTESGGIGWRDACAGTPYVPFAGVSVASDEGGQLLLRSPFLAPGSGWELMSDRIRLVSGGFEHLGRSDGVVKLGGKRIAVQEVEARARSLQGIDDAAAMVHRSTDLRGNELWLAVATAEQHWNSKTLKAALSLHFEAVVLPRRYRVLDSLPRDAVGKLQRTQLAALFGDQHGAAGPSALEQPRANLAPGAELQQCVSNFQVPSDWVFFQGHFPTSPILPGIVQLTEIVLPSIANVWQDLTVLVEAPVIKYRRLIEPGTALRLRLSRVREEPLVHFELDAAGQVASSGHLKFKTP